MTSSDVKETGTDNRKRLYQGEDIAMVADNSGFGTDVVISGPSTVALDGYTGEYSKVLAFDSTGETFGNHPSLAKRETA